MTVSMPMVSFIAIFLMTLQAPASIRTLDKGLDSNMDAARQATVHTAGEWEALWRAHGGERTRPAVDFSKEFVVAVFLGSRPTAGFSVEIVGTRDDGAGLVVQYRELAANDDLAVWLYQCGIDRTVESRIEAVRKRRLR